MAKKCALCALIPGCKGIFRGAAFTEGNDVRLSESRLQFNGNSRLRRKSGFCRSVYTNCETALVPLHLMPEEGEADWRPQLPSSRADGGNR
jgi:hypothetical protein